MLHDLAMITARQASCAFRVFAVLPFLVWQLPSSLAQSKPQDEQTAVSLAEAANEEGKKFAKQGLLIEAGQSFEKAITLHSDGRYHFNLCVIYYRLGRKSVAKEQCTKANTIASEDSTRQKARAILEKIAEETHVYPKETDNKSTQQPPTSTNKPTQQEPPKSTQENTTDSVLENNSEMTPYRWSAGGGLSILGRSVGDSSRYAASGAQLRGFVDARISNTRAIGLRGFLQVDSFAADAAPNGLTTIGVGIGPSYEIPVGGFFVTLHGGPAIAFFSDTEGSAAASLAFRLEASAAYRFGENSEHELAVLFPSIDFYTSASGELAGSAGLDGGFNWGVGVAYVHRFTTPLGRGLFLLE